MAAFAPLLESKREEIAQSRKSFKYGETDRHQLDVYYPQATGSLKKHPVLIYVYGGGFVSGERRLPAPVDLGYGNLGLYFAKRGFVTIIPDYRLAPGTTFPGPVHDVRDALIWVVAHPNDLGPDVDVDSVFIMGHSAGGVHTLTMLLHPPVLESAPALRAHIKGAAISCAPYHFEPAGVEFDLREPANMYYGSREAAKAHDPLGLLRAAPEGVLRALPPLALIKCERDQDWLQVVAKDFDAAVADKGLVPSPAQIFAKGHNHISFSWALETGQGERWAEELVAWMQSL
ncbi:alpha/beta-hydrolase, partial [Mycena pura]